nr:DNA topoisomerase IV [uncultured Flavobacterium sp.]
MKSKIHENQISNKIMSKKIVFLLPLLLLVSCYNVEHNCKDFKTGKFKFEYEVDGVKKTTVFERKESIEIETFEGKTDTSSIRWVSDCEYILQKIHPKNMEEKKAISMKILSTSKKSYTFEFGIVGSDKKQRGTVEKISDFR